MEKKWKRGISRRKKGHILIKRGRGLCTQDTRMCQEIRNYIKERSERYQQATWKTKTKKGPSQTHS